jgi:hypothetical protein
MADHPPVSDAVLARLRAACASLPEIVEEPAWVGTRWRVRTKTFAHVLVVADGWPAAYAEAVAIDDPVCVLTFRAQGEELEVLRDAPLPFFKPVWFDDIVGLVLDDRTDWDEVQELVTESYCALAPQKLVARVDRPEV